MHGCLSEREYLAGVVHVGELVVVASGEGNLLR